ncbi:MAG: hypothetical protein JXR96_22495 [Deltaproteobacteria bacterium]|nr:hypothetical protein [Deltaproteobacteria bacterium]
MRVWIYLSALCCLTIALGSMKASAQDTRKAIVIASHPKHAGNVPCRHDIEHVLRDLNFQLLLSDPSKADLVVDALAACRAKISNPMHAVGQQYFCNTGVTVKPLHGRPFKVTAQGESRGSETSALNEACSKLAKMLRSKMGAPAKSDRLRVDGDTRSPRSTPDKPQSHILVLKWKGEIRPLPLIKANIFFEKSGYQAKLIKSSKSECSFDITLLGTQEQFQEMLEAFFKVHYQVTPIDHAKMVYRLDLL